MKDLDFICKHVKVWPDGKDYVRLDADGEICFMGEENTTTWADFRPEGFCTDLFIGESSEGYNCPAVGIKYSFEEWRDHQKDLSWSVYNNTLPMVDLNDEQAAALFNAWRKGLPVGNLCGGIVISSNTPPEWRDGLVYRVKKTERELFVDTCTQALRAEGKNPPLAHEYFGILFDYGARFD